MSSISWWHQALRLLFIEAICYSFLVSGRDKTWMKASWLRLSLDKMKVVYGFGKRKVFWVDKNLLSKLREIPVIKTHKGFTVFLPHAGVPATKVTQIHLSPSRLHSLGVPGFQLTSLLLTRLTRSMQGLQCLCHYFQMLPSLFIKMFSDKSSTPPQFTAVCHPIPYRIPSIS